MQDWFKKAKLGIFIHYGIYAVKSVSESWSFHNGGISYEDYYAQLDGFTASKFNAEEWADLFKESGAKYVVMTTKHHDGVALWDTKTSDLNVIEKTPAGRDIVKEYTDAVRSRDMKVGLYYSLIDWSREDYRSVYQAGWPIGDRNIYSSPGYGEERPELWAQFLKFNDAQMTELLSNYGKIDLLWFDGDWERSAEQWKMAKFKELLLSLQPEVICNSRMQGYGDYATPEQGIPVVAPQGPWEFCITLNDSWGFRAWDDHHKSTRQVIRMLCECITMGGNMLLDVGPKEDGTIIPEQVQVLKELGQWIREHKEAIYETEKGLDYKFFQGGSALSEDKKTLYLFVYDKPNEFVCIKGLKTKINRASILHNGREITWDITGGAPWNGIPGLTWVYIPEDALHPLVTVVKLELDEPIDLYCEAGSVISHND